jgi:hypothetical protein
MKRDEEQDRLALEADRRRVLMARGVEFTAPPPSLLEQATAIVEAASARLPTDARGGIIAVATPGGWNAAIVHRASERFEVASWIGKSWRGGLTGGAAVRASW